MNRYTELRIEGYERVVRCDNPDCGFSAWIAIHDTSLGPALGGCRVWPYSSDEAAVFDVLRLSRGMTYKNSLAGLPLGGGKSVVRTEPARIDRYRLFSAIGDFVEWVSPDYIIAEDVNSTVEDMAVVKHRTSRVATVGASGNPSPFTAYGVFCATKAAVAQRLNRQDLVGVKVAIQGVGETGGRLAELLAGAGCRLTVADINPAHLERLTFDCAVVEPDTIYDTDCDVFAPCALGGTLNPQTIPRLLCRIVAGSANNQLLADADGYALFARNILYVPDYVANAGGVINISCELERSYDAAYAYRQTERIGDTVATLIRTSIARQVPPHILADSLAERNLETGTVDWRSRLCRPVMQHT